ncbi:MAG: insulinase family protein [Candidatus Moduliflexus flocculans]|nr:insulinase family protein [Candidatus Moduliflexus flocculans]
MDSYDPDFFPFLVLKQILGGTTRSRLFMNLRENPGATPTTPSARRSSSARAASTGPGPWSARSRSSRPSRRSSARSRPWPPSRPPWPRSRRPSPTSSATCPCASKSTSGLRGLDGPLRRPVPRRRPVGQGAGVVPAGRWRNGSAETARKYLAAKPLVVIVGRPGVAGRPLVDDFDVRRGLRHQRHAQVHRAAKEPDHEARRMRPQLQRGPRHRRRSRPSPGEIEAVAGVKLLDVDPGSLDEPDRRDLHRPARGRRGGRLPGHRQGRRGHRHARPTRAPTAASGRPTSAPSSPSPE